MFFGRKADETVGLEGKGFCQKPRVHPVRLDFLSRGAGYCGRRDDDAGISFLLEFPAKSIAGGARLVAYEEHSFTSDCLLKVSQVVDGVLKF